MVTKTFPGATITPKRIFDNVNWRRKCGKCGEMKPMDCFYNQRASSDGKMPWCKICSDKSARDWRANNPQYKEERRQYGVKYFQENKEFIFIRQKKHHKVIKEEVMTHYGGGKLGCVKCGIDDIDVLCIDHINGGGAKHRKQLTFMGGINFYYWLKRNGYPEGYQTLCANCNLKKKIRENEK